MCLIDMGREQVLAAGREVRRGNARVTAAMVLVWASSVPPSCTAPCTALLYRRQPLGGDVCRLSLMTSPHLHTNTPSFLVSCPLYRPLYRRQAHGGDAYRLFIMTSPYQRTLETTDQLLEVFTDQQAS